MLTGIFTKPPPEEEAVATVAGLVINCANSALYMANYNLVVRLLAWLWYLHRVLVGRLHTSNF